MPEIESWPSDAERRWDARVAAERVLRCLLQPAEGGPEVAATLVDASRFGLGLITPHALPAGAEIVVRLRSSAGERAGPLLRARVIHTRELSKGRLLVGVELTTPLTAEERDALLRRITLAVDLGAHGSSLGDDPTVHG